VPGSKNGRATDPFRIDTKSNRLNAEWFATQFNSAFIGIGKHLRGVHYVFSVGGEKVKPNGHPYLNNFPNWRFLIEKCAKFARWLGLVSWSRIPDARGSDPFVNRAARAGEAESKLLTAMPVPDELDVTPTPVLDGFVADQPFALAFFTEKAAVVTLLKAVAARCGGNLYVSSGDMVDRRIWEMARDAYADGRKLIVFTISDCDPAGHAMPRAIARKLQAHSVATFPGLEFEMVRAGLTPSQARALELPDAPLKETETRADAWTDAFDIGQIEIDAAVALKPDDFRAMIEAKVEPYFDATLADRVEEAASAWREEAEEVVRDRIPPHLELAILQARYDAARAEIEAVNARLEAIAADITLPDPPPPPTPDMDGKAERRSPLIDSAWGFVKGTLALIADRGYEGADDEVDDGEPDESDDESE
jgi:hypothetical protein